MSNYPLLNLFLTMLWFFLWILWIFLLIRVLTDVFRSHDLGGWGKAGWTILLILLPFIGVLGYLIFRGDKMASHEVADAKAADEATRAYIQSAAGSSTSTAEELSKLAALRDQGIITEQEFGAQKARILG